MIIITMIGSVLIFIAGIIVGSGLVVYSQRQKERENGQQDHQGSEGRR